MPEHLLSLRMLHQDTSHQAFAGVCSGCGSRLGGTEATALLEEMARPPSGGGVGGAHSYVFSMALAVSVLLWGPLFSTLNGGP